MNSQTQQLGIFGWNQSSINANVTVRPNGDVTIFNAVSLLSLLPGQKAGTALYEVNNSNIPIGQLSEQPYDLSNLDLVPQQGVSAIEFELQADGTYKLQGNGSVTLTKVSNQFRLQLKNDTVMVFRPDGQVDYVQDANGYRINASYNSSGLLSSLSTTSGENFTYSYNLHSAGTFRRDNKS
jgi:hypothetical protein